MKKSDENNLIRVVRAIAIYNIMSVCAWPGTKKTKKKHLKFISLHKKKKTNLKLLLRQNS